VGLSKDQAKQVRDLNKEYANGKGSEADWREDFQKITGKDPMDLEEGWER
jgi:hypothetical protein